MFIGIHGGVVEGCLLCAQVHQLLSMPGVWVCYLFSIYIKYIIIWVDFIGFDTMTQNIMFFSNILLSVLLILNSIYTYLSLLINTVFILFNMLKIRDNFSTRTRTYTVFVTSFPRKYTSWILVSVVLITVSAKNITSSALLLVLLVLS